MARSVTPARCRRSLPYTERSMSFFPLSMTAETRPAKSKHRKRRMGLDGVRARIRTSAGRRICVADSSLAAASRWSVGGRRRALCNLTVLIKYYRGRRAGNIYQNLVFKIRGCAFCILQRSCRPALLSCERERHQAISITPVMGASFTVGMSAADASAQDDRFGMWNSYCPRAGHESFGSYDMQAAETTFKLLLCAYEETVSYNLDPMHTLWTGRKAGGEALRQERNTNLLTEALGMRFILFPQTRDSIPMASGSSLYCPAIMTDMKLPVPSLREIRKTS
ncbi:hypothetical protein F4778DRAFT_75512 [Xylariomycetidae sp. FL2044]|nr:hypothetical protein F4778DRAFT_75512 [Xylariomycetidae sp. FL2044]